MGADYLVVGRPIIKATDPVKAAQDVIDEIDQAPKPQGNQSSSGGSAPQSYERWRQKLRTKPGLKKSLFLIPAILQRSCRRSTES